MVELYLFIALLFSIWMRAWPNKTEIHVHISDVKGETSKP